MLQYSPVFTGCPAVELAIRRLYESDDEHRETRFWGLVRGLNYALQMQTRVLVPVQLSGAKPQGEFSWAQDPIPPEKARGLSYWTLTTPKKIKMLPVFTRPEEADANPATLGLPMAELPLEQVMEETLARQDLTGLVVNPWDRSASLEKGLLKGLLRAPNPEDSPGEARCARGCSWRPRASGKRPVPCLRKLPRPAAPRGRAVWQTAATGAWAAPGTGAGP